MKFEFEIPDDTVASVQEFITHQITVYPDPETNLPTHKKQYEDVHDYFEKSLMNSCQVPCLQFPSPALREQLIAKKRAEDAFAAAIKPTVNRNAPQATKAQAFTPASPPMPPSDSAA